MILDWIAASFAIIGVYLIGYKNKYGFLFCVVSGLLWIIVALYTGLYGLFLEVTPLFFLNIFNFIKWKKQEKKLH